MDDIASLVNYFIEKYNQGLAGRVEGISPEAMQALLAYPWPGNIRELENVIKRIIVLGGEGSVRPEHLPLEIRQGGSPPLPAAGNTLESLERAQIARALKEARGNQSQAARLLGISREKLRYRMRKYGLGGRDGARDTISGGTV